MDIIKLIHLEKSENTHTAEHFGFSNHQRKWKKYRKNIEIDNVITTECFGKK